MIPARVTEVRHCFGENVAVLSVEPPAGQEREQFELFAALAKWLRDHADTEFHVRSVQVLYDEDAGDYLLVVVSPAPPGSDPVTHHYGKSE